MTQRDRLLGRKLPTTWVSVRVDFSADSDAAELALADAQRVLVVAQSNGDPDRLATAREAVEEAQRRYDPFAEKLEVRPLAPAEFEQLVSEHPAGSAGRSWATSFVPALLAACVISELTEEDWLMLATKGDQFASGEIGQLFQAALQVNDRSPGIAVSKG